MAILHAVSSMGQRSAKSTATFGQCEAPLLDNRDRNSLEHVAYTASIHKDGTETWSSVARGRILEGTRKKP